MGNSIVTMGAEADVTTDAAVSNGEDEGGKLGLHSRCQDWMVAQYETDYPTSLDARRFVRCSPTGATR